MKHVTTLLICAAVVIFGAQVAVAETSDSEKLQNQVNDFQDNLEDYAVDFDDAQALELPEDSESEDEDRELAQMKYDDALPTFIAVLEDIQDAQGTTKYMSDIHKKDKRNVRVALQDMYIEIYALQNNMQDAMNLEDSSDMLNAVEDAIADAESYLNTNDGKWHDALQLYLEGHADALETNYTDALEVVDNIYELYKIELGEENITAFADDRNNFNSEYSEGVALLERAKSSSENRDLQLFNRAINKFTKARSALKKTYSEIDALEETL